MPKYFDTHSHLNFPQYDEDRGEVITRMETDDVFTVIVGTDSKTSQESIDLAETNERFFASIGLHPSDNNIQKFDDETFNEMLKSRKVVAVGETGLDYFRSEKGDKERQIEIFRQQIEFAVKSNLPLIVHCRDAYEDVLRILSEYKKEYGDGLRGVMHFFVGDMDIAKRVLDLGFNISFTGVVTFAKEYEELVEKIPLDRVMAETDAPYVAPVPKRGERNEPTYVKYIYAKIAEIRGEDPEKVRETLTQNALNFFSIK